MQINIAQRILVGYFSLLVVYWATLAVLGLKDTLWNYYYSFAFSLVPLVFGLFGLFLVKQWGGLTSVMGRGLSAVFLGLFSWGAGSMVWSFYNIIEGVPAPYPSIADIGFVLSIILWIFGMYSLSRITGIRFAIKNTAGLVWLIVVPLVVIVFSYYFLVIVARGGVVTSSDLLDTKLLLDLAYPIGDVVILTFALLILSLSSKYLGGMYRWSTIVTLAGFILMYFADFIFSYTTTVGTFYVGNFGDLVFTVALSTITMGALDFAKPRTEVV